MSENRSSSSSNSNMKLLRYVLPILLILFAVSRFTNGVQVSEAEPRRHSDANPEAVAEPNVPPSGDTSSDGTCSNATSGAPDWSTEDYCLNGLTAEMQSKFENIRTQFEQATNDGTRLYITSSYRSIASQAQIYRHCRSIEQIQSKAHELEFEYNRPDLATTLQAVGRVPDEPHCQQYTQAGPGESAHNYGLAFDAWPVKNGQIIDDIHYWQIYGQIVRSNGLTWGGCFGDDSCRNGWDKSHAQANGFSGSRSVSDNRPLFQPSGTTVSPTAVADQFNLQLLDFMDAIAYNESDTAGGYEAHNDTTGAHGRWQVMPDNWPNWAQEAGLPADAEQSPDNQNRVVAHKMTEYYSRFGNWHDVAVAWFAGPGAVGDPRALGRSDGISTVEHYVERALEHMNSN